MKLKSIQCRNHGVSEFPCYKASVGNYRQFPGSALPHRFRVSGNPCKPQCRGMCKFVYHEEILWKAVSFPGCGFLRKLEVIRKPKQFSEHESSKISYYGNTIGKTALFLYYGLWLKINWVRQTTQFPDMGN